MSSTYKLIIGFCKVFRPQCVSFSGNTVYVAVPRICHLSVGSDQVCVFLTECVSQLWFSGVFMNRRTLVIKQQDTE